MNSDTDEIGSLEFTAAETDVSGGVTLKISGARYALPSHAVSRSQLLTDLCQQSGGACNVLLPVKASVMQLWLRHIRCSATGIDGTYETLTGPQQSETAATDMHSSKKLLQAADVLIDEATRLQMCRSLALEVEHAAAVAECVTPQRTGGPAAPAGHCAYAPTSQKAVTGLSEGLQLSILQHAPLAACLAALPPAMHPLALSAHAPAIHMHAHSALTLPPLPLRLLPCACDAAASFSHLRSLSLADHVLSPHDASLALLLRALPALTALSLADCGLRAACGRALAAALPRLPHLQSLDLSSSRLPRRAFQGVCSGLRMLRTLTELRLRETVVSNVPDDMHALADALLGMPALAALSIGGLGTQHKLPWTSLFMRALAKLLRALCAAAALTELEFRFDEGRCHAASAELAVVWASLAHLRQLRRLSLGVPVVTGTECEGPVWEWALGLSLAALSQLTELQLQLSVGVVHGVTEPPRGLAIIAGLTALTALRELRLPWCAVTAGTALVPDSRAALLGVLCLPQLTTLHICTDCLRAVTSGHHNAVTVNKIVACDDEVVGMLRAATQLRRLRMPLHSVSPEVAESIQTLLAMRLRHRSRSSEANNEPITLEHHSDSGSEPAAHLEELVIHPVFSSMHDEDPPPDHPAWQQALLESFIPLLPSADRVYLAGENVLWLTALTRNPGVLRAVTHLALRVEEPDSESLAAYNAFTRQLSTLRALRDLGICVHGIPAAAPGRDPLPPEATASRLDFSAFCSQLPALTALTSLQLSMAPEGFDDVLAACAAHGGLRKLDIQTHAAHCPSLPVGALSTLRTLVVLVDGIAAAGNFWAELPRLTALRYLGMHAPLTAERLCQLAEVAGDGLPALRQVHVSGVPHELCAIIGQEDMPCIFVCQP